MSENSVFLCPDCGNDVIDTRGSFQPYRSDDDYYGYRCTMCKRTFSDDEIKDLKGSSLSRRQGKGESPKSGSGEYSSDNVLWARSVKIK
jgi:hypothetical protein